MTQDTREQQLEEREKDRDVTQAEIAAYEAAEDSDVELLKELIESELHPGTVRVLDNYLGPSFILSNLAPEEIEEFKWMLRIRSMRAIEMVHPPQDGLTGETRAIYYDDESANLPALSDLEKNIARAFVDGVWFRALRSQEGFQQDKINESANVVERRSQSDDSDDMGGIF